MLGSSGELSRSPDMQNRYTRMKAIHRLHIAMKCMSCRTRPNLATAGGEKILSCSPRGLYALWGRAHCGPRGCDAFGEEMSLAGVGVH